MERGGYSNRGRGRRGRRGGNGGRGHPPPPRQLWQHRPTNVTTNSSSSTQAPTHKFQTPPPDIGALSISDPAEKKVTVTPLHRPDKGGIVAVRTCNLSVNHFLVNFDTERIIMHYHVDVKVKSPRIQKISKSDLAMIRDKLFSDSRLPSIAMTAYDGESTLYSAVPLPEETFIVDVSRGEDEKVVSYIVTLKLVNRLEVRKLRDYLNGRELSVPREILQGMDLVMKENPTKCTVSVGRCFFPMNAPERDIRKLEDGVIAARGFQQSLMTTSQGLALRLDPSVLSFKMQMPVLDYLKARVKYFNLNEFWKFKKEVERALVGLKVNVTHRRTKQKYTIARLTSKNTRHITFPILDLEGQKPLKNTSLLAYFRDKYRLEIQHKDIPALDFGGNKTNYVPMELCVLAEGQRFPKEQLQKFSAKALKDLSVAPPKVRRNAIEKMVNSSSGPIGGDIIQSFGMNVITSMTNVTGRVLKPPELKLGDSNGKITTMSLDHRKCQWNLVGRSMVEGKPVECWGILDFTSKGPNWCQLRGDQFIENLIDKYRRLGIDMKEPVWYECSAMWKLGSYDLLFELLENINENVQKKCRRGLQFLLCVMADKDQGYKCLKWIAETKVGIVTQCCLSSHANEAKDQYLTNLALKINAKIGGSNVELTSRLPHFEGEGHVMFIGADVNHPGSRDTNSPSIAAVVATMNWPAANRYAARVCVQHHRSEKILNFGNICLDLVTYYVRVNKVRPEKIVIFRDGVSESQFRMVLTEELEDLKEEFHRRNYFPTITLIVAQKRHQTRLFPTGEKDGTPNGNVFPGTVVDTKVVHPFEFDFYLCSHYGSLGTSKPTHYHVLWDEHNFTSDDLQKLIYDMCFTFARCTKPVSLVPPVYYADLAAYRGRLYYEARVWAQSPDSGASSLSSATASSSLSSAISNSFDLGRYQLHADVENVMFFI